MSRLNLLYVVHRLPYPPDKGDRIRAWNLLKFLSQHANVYLACIADEPVDETALAALQLHCKKVAVVRLSGWARRSGALLSLARGRTASEGAFGSAALSRTIAQWATKIPFEVALASASSVAGFLLLPKLQDARKIVDFVDVDSEKWLEYAAASHGAKSWLYRTEGRRLRAVEQDVSRWAQAITLVSDAEVKLFRSFCRTGSVKAITNGVDLDYFAPAPTGAETGCLFVGAMDYRPNVDAVCWFCREVWATIKELERDAQFQIVGRRPVGAVRRLSKIRGVQVVGQVPDVRPYLADAAIAVMPLQIARGIQNKVLEALAMGKAVVASPQALEGLDVTPGEHVLSASTKNEWVAAIRSLMEDNRLRERLGQSGRRFVEQHHAWDRCLEPFASLLGITAAALPGVACES
jgi:sugar transferase (PEP-CTERM/EpsH1 system associated)